MERNAPNKIDKDMQFYFSKPEVDYQNEADNHNEVDDITYEEGRPTINIQPPPRNM